MSTRRATVEGGVFVALGLIAIVQALRLRDNWHGAKLMPAVVGAALVALISQKMGIRK